MTDLIEKQAVKLPDREIFHKRFFEKVLAEPAWP
jgi:hypothetical protein